MANRSKVNTYQSSLDQARRDRYARVDEREKQILALMNSIDGSRISQQGATVLADCHRDLMATVTEFRRQQDALVPLIEARVKSIVTQNRIRRGVTLVLLVVGVFQILASFTGNGSGGLGLLLIVLALIVRSIGRKTLTASAEAVARDAVVPQRTATSLIGGPARGKLGASGLYAKVDAVFLGQLDPETRGRELQRREYEKNDAERILQARSQQRESSGQPVRRPGDPLESRRAGEGALDYSARVGGTVGECDTCGTALSYHDLYSYQKCPNPDCPRHFGISGREIVAYEHVDTDLTEW